MRLNYQKINNVELEVIFPWGFEVFKKDIFLYKNLRRFYCYFGIKSNQSGKSIQTIESELLRNIYIEIRKFDKQFYEDITVLLQSEEAILLKNKDYQCKERDKALIVIVRESQDILQDYSKYVLSTIWQILYKQAEVEKHDIFLIKRWRFFQLYLMLESIFSGYLSPLSREDDKLKKSITFLTDNQIWIFYRPDLAESERKQKLFQYIHS